jgi:4-hydroxybenzoyl-CoA thioesterase
MSFEVRTQVRFAHVDAAGIVFYPRFFEMLNGAVEDWFDQGLGCHFSVLQKVHGLAVPTVHLETLSFAFTVAGERRLGGKVVLVCMELGVRRARPWPDDLRAGMQSALAG